MVLDALSAKAGGVFERDVPLLQSFRRELYMELARSISRDLTT